MQGIRKVSHSSQNPGREYMKCLRCDKFLKWVNDDNEMEKRILVMLTEIKKELSELRMLVKLKCCVHVLNWYYCISRHCDGSLKFNC